VWRRKPVNEWVPCRVAPVKGEWPAVARPLLSLKRWPHLQTRTCLGENKKTRSWFPMGFETKIYCAVEGQQQFDRPSVLWNVKYFSQL
jgi:hypothetical protein